MLILASASPRRKMLLEECGFAPTVRVPGIEEKRGPLETPLDYALRNAQEKALAVVSRSGDVVVAADTIVVVPTASGEELLEKPADPADARRMLGLLSGRTHKVYTGFALALDGAVRHNEAVCTEVTFRSLSPGEIDDYIATGQPFDKAGSYGIQGRAMSFVAHVKGSYTNIVGLPLAEFMEAYRRLEPGA